MNSQTSNFEELNARIWQAFEQAPLDPSDPFRAPVLGTASSCCCALRTVILRKAAASERILGCYSDSRAPKISQIQINPHVQWLFYRPEERIQIIARATAAVHHMNSVARAAWDNTLLEHRLNYSSVFAPGSEISAPDSIALLHRGGRPPAPKELDRAFANFAVIVTTVEHLDFLRLNLDGNRRAAFTWNGTSFKGSWLAA